MLDCVFVKSMLTLIKIASLLHSGLFEFFLFLFGLLQSSKIHHRGQHGSPQISLLNMLLQSLDPTFGLEHTPFPMASKYLTTYKAIIVII